MATQLVVPPELLTTDRSTYKLTQLAKRIAMPGNIEGTDWGPVAKTCRDDLGISFDGWQDGMGQLLLARSTVKHLWDGGMLAHTVGGFHLSAMRQIGKTYFVAGALFGLCQKYPGLLVIWTAHHSATSDETFEAIQGFANRVRIRPHIEFIHTGSGDEEVKFYNGSRILFGARERGFGRGIPGVDVMMFDEGQIMSERAMQNMIATLNTSWLGLHIYAGTPPKPEDNSENWMRMHDEAWEIEDSSIVVVHTNDMVWVEFGADDNVDRAAGRDDVRQWIRNPSFPHRTPIQAFMRLRRKLNDEGFDREGLGLYDPKGKSIFDMNRWNDLILEGVEQPNRAALVLDVSPTQSWSCLGIAAEIPGTAESDDEEDRVLIMVKSIRGTTGVAKVIKELDKERDLFDIALTPGAARAIETELVKLGVEYEIMPTNEVAASYGTLQAAIKAGTVAHVGQPELDVAMKAVKSRFLQTGESQSFDRREVKEKAKGQVDEIDTSPAVAAACALYRHGIHNAPMPYLG